MDDWGGDTVGWGTIGLLRQGFKTEICRGGDLGREIAANLWLGRLGHSNAVPLQRRRRNFNLLPVVNRVLLVAAVGGFFAVFVDVLDYALENEQVWGALAG